MIQLRLRKCLVWIGVAATSLTAIAARAQKQQSAPFGPAPILVTVQETIQPGQEALHARLEADYAVAMNAAQAKQYYLGMDEISGSAQSMFLSGYSSLQEMADVHDNDATVIGDKLDHLETEHNATLLGTDTSIWRLRPDLSNPSPESLGSMRFMELIHIHAKLGHDAEVSSVLRKVGDAWVQTDPNFHYSVYQQIFGNAKDNSILIIIPVKSLDAIDKHQSLVPQYLKNMGEELHKHMLEVRSTDYNSVESNLYVFAPSMSRLPESWTKDDADFWNPKPVTTVPASKPTSAKPASPR